MNKYVSHPPNRDTRHVLGIFRGRCECFRNLWGPLRNVSESFGTSSEPTKNVSGSFEIISNRFGNILESMWIIPGVNKSALEIFWAPSFCFEFFGIVFDLFRNQKTRLGIVRSPFNICSKSFGLDPKPIGAKSFNNRYRPRKIS